MYKSVLAAGLMLAVAAAAQGSVLVTFSDTGADSFTGNFVELFMDGGASNRSAAQDNVNQNFRHYSGTGSGASTFIATYAAGGGNSSTYTPTTFSDTEFTVSADIVFSTSNMSFGFFIGNPAADQTANDLLALFNLDNSASSGNDRIRFSNDAKFGLFPQVPGSLDGGDVQSNTGLTFGSVITLTLTKTAAGLTLSATDGTNTLSSGPYTGYTLPASYEIGFRSGNSVTNSTITVDNFSIVPEPSSMAAVFGLAGLALRRRKR